MSEITEDAARIGREVDAVIASRRYQLRKDEEHIRPRTPSALLLDASIAERGAMLTGLQAISRLSVETLLVPEVENGPETYVAEQVLRRVCEALYIDLPLQAEDD